ncbi:Histidinol-phosphate aminotransferase [Grifola frondosa]|uniref:Histidinol-phosphate aminotransferase n=1 Tax=Grifola frondosa TaxID=5627 RepID=A0A1C7MLH9_GRIFR|nr:Histidinol-phosphate aminotransferase [Grifola frondosa]
MNTKAPYNISTPTASLALSALSPSALASMSAKVIRLVTARTALLAGLAELAPLGLGAAIGGNDANFVLVPVLEKNAGSGGRADNVRAHQVYKMMARKRAWWYASEATNRGAQGVCASLLGARRKTASCYRNWGSC